MKISSFKLLVNNIAITSMALTACSALLTYFKTWILSSSLSVSQFGFFIYISTIIGWIITITSSGLNNGLLSYLISLDRKSNFHRIVGWVLALSFKRGVIGIVAALTVFIVLLHPQPYDVIILYLSMTFLIPISIATYSLNSVMLYLGKVSLNALINTLILNGGSVLLLLLFLRYGIDYYVLAVAVVVPALVTHGLLTRFTNCRPIFKVTDSLAIEKKTIASLSNHMLFSALLYAFWIKAETFFLNSACGPSCVGYFYIPYQFAFLLTIVNTVMYGIVSAKLSRNTFDLDYRRRLYKSASLFSFSINLIVFMFIYLNSGELLGIFGSEYNTSDGTIMMKLLSTAFLFYSYFGSTAEVYLNLLGGHKHLLNSALLTALMSLLTNAIFTLQYGVTGAAISFFITIMTASLTRIYFVKRYLNICLNKSYSIVLKTMLIIVFLEFIAVYIGQFSGYKKIIMANFIIFVLMLIFIIHQRRVIFEYLKFLGLVQENSNK